MMELSGIAPKVWVIQVADKRTGTGIDSLMKLKEFLDGIFWVQISVSS